MEKSSQNSPSFGQGLELSGIIAKAIASAAKKTNANSDTIQKIVGKPGIIFQFFENLFAEGTQQNPSILRLISGTEKLMIESLDGKATIADAKKIFKSCSEEDFKYFGLNIPGQATPEALIDVHEITEDGTYIQIFGAITPDLEKIVMSQNQVVRFCEKHPTWLQQEEYLTFFLIKENGEYFVVCVRVDSDGLRVGVTRLKYDCIWNSEHHYRVVTPQLLAA